MRGKHILLGVSGGIAAYKSAQLARGFVREDAQVRVIMTASACEFVTPLTFESLTGHPAATGMFGPRPESAHAHVELARWAEVMVVAPATANTIAKLALGIASDLLSTTALSSSAPLVLAPAMNSSMWGHPAVQANVATLRDRGAFIVGPGEGELACGEKGPGRMAEPGEILDAVRGILAR